MYSNTDEAVKVRQTIIRDERLVPAFIFNSYFTSSLRAEVCMYSRRCVALAQTSSH
jgi:hypothetical protein